MKTLFNSIFAIMLFATNTFSQTAYCGTIGKAKVEFAIYAPAEHNDTTDTTETEGVYIYTKYNDPICMSGYIHHDTLVLTEDSTATIIFQKYSDTAMHLEGIWNSTRANKQLPVFLERQYAVYAYDLTKDEMENRSIIQRYSTKKFYFRIIVPSQSTDAFTIQIFNKQTGAKLQEFYDETYFNGIWTIESPEMHFKIGADEGFSYVMRILSNPLREETATYKYDNHKKQFVQICCDYKDEQAEE